MSEIKPEETIQPFKEIMREDLRKKLESGDKFHLWDARTKTYFTNEVIRGAKWVPADQLEGQLGSLGVQKNDEIVVGGLPTVSLK